MLVGLLIGSNISGKCESFGSNGLALLLAKAPQHVVSFPLVTVQDTAAAHISALKQSKTNGKRVLVLEKLFFSHDAVQIAKDKVPDLLAGPLQPHPEPGQYVGVEPEQIKQDEHLLGLQFESVDDTYVQLLRDNV